MRREPENVLATLQLNPRVFHGLYGIRLITYRFEHKRKVHERSTSSVPQSLGHCTTGFRMIPLLPAAVSGLIFGCIVPSYVAKSLLCGWPCTTIGLMPADVVVLSRLLS